MSVPAFPAYAKILRDGYSDQANYGVLRTDMDGLAKQRPRWSKPIVTRSVNILVMSVSDRLALDAFVRDDLAGGSGWFTFIDPVDHLTKQGRLVGGTLQWSTPGVVWQAQAQIESIG